MRYSLALFLFTAMTSTPAIAADTQDGDAEYGQKLFSALCVTCHKEDARGDDRAPDIRGAPVAAIRRGTSGMDSMQDFYLEEEDILAVRAYLATLVE
ncbi:cytochrome c [Tropicimonas sp. IMCC6043]|uniref:c-type cytochrome n=1 Tax=Tropicimonas sp. IMCC6043 TaxID=2510645 RepID=UPI00101C16C1|nr:cytochrome c [Tropicimonas sp. IMCC6043]RYH10081.1 cytochrome c [Tropicimonas sp. IMCC6043]